MRIEIRLLYFLYFLYLLGIFISGRGSLIGLYAVNVCSISVIAGMIFYNKLIYRTQSIWKFLIIFIFIFIYSSIAFTNSKDINGALLIIKICLLLIFFRLYKIELRLLISFLNRTYLIFVSLSIIFFYLIPNTLYTLNTHPSFYIDAYFYKYLVFQSIQGSASSIDSYSGLILLLNLFIPIKKNTKRKFYIVLSIVFIILSLKMTPLVSLVFSLLAYLFIRNKRMATLYLITGMSLFISVLFLLFKNSVFFGVPFVFIMYKATHARSMVWVQQLLVLWEGYSVFDYIFGNFSSESFSVQAFQITGYAKEQYIDNPHNNFLLLFYRWPLMFIFLFFGFIRIIYKNFDRRWFVIVAFIFVACFTNSTIISLQNPIYIMIICYIGNLKYHDIRIS